MKLPPTTFQPPRRSIVFPPPEPVPRPANGPMGRTIAFDYGERRIGIAVSDPTRTIASPLATLQRRAGKRPPWPEIARLVREQEADEAVVGLPLDLAGDEGAWAAEVRAFGDDLARRTG